MVPNIFCSVNETCVLASFSETPYYTWYQDGSETKLNCQTTGLFKLKRVKAIKNASHFIKTENQNFNNINKQLYNYLITKTSIANQTPPKCELNFTVIKSVDIGGGNIGLALGLSKDSNNK